MPEKDDIPVIFSQLVIRQRDDSGHAIAAYRDTWRLLLTYASDQIGIAPARLDLTDLDAPLIAAFLEHSNTSAATPFAPATRGWPRSSRCSGSPP
jgi:hypothetical protein